jgi:hypothetical protein
MLKGKKLNGSSISQAQVSTKDLRNYCFKLHKLQVKELFSSCAIRKINTEKLVLP